VTTTATGLSVTWKGLIATGYRHVPNAAALVLGPTGLAYDTATDTLYVASTAENAIFAIPHAGTRSTPVARGTLVAADGRLRGPLALRFAPNGDLLTANGDAVHGDPLHPSEIVELTTAGDFVSEYNVDPSQGGAFGIDVCMSTACPFNYAVIDDVTNTLSVSRLGLP
jgi:DNA-binding beta-propeller fold protein YncE